MKELGNIDKRVEQLSDLNHLVLEVSKANDLEAVFRHIVNDLPGIMGAENCTLLIDNPDTPGWVFRSTQALDADIKIHPNSSSVLLTVLKTSVPRRTNNPAEEPDFYEEIDSIAGVKTQSLLAVPIILRGKSIGVIELINKISGDFSNDDEELLATTAVHIAAAIDRYWIADSSARRMQELSILVEISRTISTSLDLDTLFDNIAKTLLETTQLDEFSISAWDSQDDKITTLLDCIKCDEKDFRKTNGTVYALKKYPVKKHTLEAREISIFNVDDPDVDKNEIARLVKRNRAIIMMVPMIVRNHVTGLLEIYFSEGNPNWQRSTNLYQAIANQVGAAIENTRLHQETRSQTAQLEQRVLDRTKELEQLYEQQAALTESERRQRELVETLSEAGAIVASTLDPGSAINEILNQLSRVIPHDSASIQLLNEDELVIVAGGGWLEYDKMQGYRFRVPGNNPNTLVLKKQKPIIMNRERLMQFEEFQKVSHGNIHSWLGVPLITQDMAIGMLTLDSAHDEYFTEEHASLAIAFADQVAVALEQAILFQKTQAALNERDALRTIMVEITSELDLDSLLSAVMTKTCELLTTMSAEIALYDPDTNKLEIVAVHNQEEHFVGINIEMGKGLLGQTALHRKPILLKDYSNWEHALPEYKPYIWRASMASPLIYRNRLIGIIVVGDKRPEKSFTQSDLDLLEMLGHQVAIAIENAQLFQKVQMLATTDELTGLHNRRELFRIGGELFKLSNESDMPLSAVMFDIDLFKTVNDTYGHSTGDQVLAGLAKVCQHKIRDNDILCRYGGEEFTLVLPGADLETSRLVAERLRTAVQQTPIKTDKGDIKITMSFGVAMLRARHASLAALVDEADAAMYRAKNMGRNRVETHKEHEART